METKLFGGNKFAKNTIFFFFVTLSEGWLKETEENRTFWVLSTDALSVSSIRVANSQIAVRFQQKARFNNNFNSTISTNSALVWNYFQAKSVVCRSHTKNWIKLICTRLINAITYLYTLYILHRNLTLIGYVKKTPIQLFYWGKLYRIRVETDRLSISPQQKY